MALAEGRTSLRRNDSKSSSLKVDHPQNCLAHLRPTRPFLFDPSESEEGVVEEDVTPLPQGGTGKRCQGEVESQRGATGVAASIPLSGMKTPKNRSSPTLLMTSGVFMGFA